MKSRPAKSKTVCPWHRLTAQIRPSQAIHRNLNDIVGLKLDGLNELDLIERSRHDKIRQNLSTLNDDHNRDGENPEACKDFPDAVDFQPGERAPADSEMCANLFLARERGEKLIDVIVTLDVRWEMKFQLQRRRWRAWRLGRHRPYRWRRP